jgi:adhesin transport system outer membrane protein
MIHLDCQKYFLRSTAKTKPSQGLWVVIKHACPGILLASIGVSVQAQTLVEVVNQALQTYPAVLSAAAKASASRSDIARARSAHYPQLGMTATANAFASGTYPSGTSRSSLSPTAKVNVWSGGKIEAEAQRAEALTQASEFLQANTLDEVAQLAAEAYLNWAKTADLYSLAVHNVNAHEETLSDIRKIAQADTGRRVDYEQALVRMENATLSLQQRKSDFAQAIQRVRRFWTADMASRPEGLDAALAESGVLGKIPTSLPQAVEMVSLDLPSIAQARAQVQAAQAGVRVAKSQFWPTVDLSVSKQANTANGRQEAFTQLQVNAPFYNGGGTAALVEGAVGQLKVAEFALEEGALT